jgi:hypothetical protein
MTEIIIIIIITIIIITHREHELEDAVEREGDVGRDGRLGRRAHVRVEKVMGRVADHATAVITERKREPAQATGRRAVRMRVFKDTFSWNHGLVMTPRPKVVVVGGGFLDSPDHHPED